MPYVPKEKRKSKSFSFRFPPEVSEQHEHVEALCKKHGGRLELASVLVQATIAELKAVQKQLESKEKPN